MHVVPSAKDPVCLGTCSGEGLATFAQHHDASFSRNVTFHQVLIQDRPHQPRIGVDDAKTAIEIF